MALTTDRKKAETAEALAREQAVTDLKALHTKMDLEKEAVRKAELEKELMENKVSTDLLKDDAAEQAKDGKARAAVVDKAVEVTKL